MKTKQLSQIILALVFSLFLAACGSTKQEASTGQYIDDTVVTSRVKAALLNDAAVSGLAINVETFKGTVQLSGFVKTATERNLAVKLTRDVAGVKQVKNDILIR